MRGESSREVLHEDRVDPDPLKQFQLWYDEALAAGLAQPDAMALATATPDGRPSVRMVLLKGVIDGGFTFHTNYESRKGQELAQNPQGALAFFWPELRRQVRVEGSLSRVSAEESDAYFRTRPWESRLAALASPQSRRLESREALDRRVVDLTQRYQGREVPRPSYWGGYRLTPVSVELWQGHPHRLHDRLLYQRQDNGSWIITRLAP